MTEKHGRMPHLPDRLIGSISDFNIDLGPHITVELGAELEFSYLYHWKIPVLVSYLQLMTMHLGYIIQKLFDFTGSSHSKPHPDKSVNLDS